MSPAALSPLLPATLRWLLYAVTAGMLGLAVFRSAVLDPLRREIAFPMVAFPALRRAWALGWGVAIVAALLPPVRLGVEAVRRFGPDAVLQARGILTTPWGIGWSLEVIAAGLLAIGLAIAGAQGRRPGWTLVGIAASLASLVPALSGHASDLSGLSALAVLNDALHVAGAGAWVGGLALVVLVGLPAVREADIPEQLGGGVSFPAEMLIRFSRLAVAALVVVSATGAVSAWLQVGSWSALTGTGYGRILLIKLALVMPVAAVGLHHARGTRTAGEDGTDLLRPQPAIMAELTLALVVLAITAVLALTPTPAQLTP